MSLSVGEDELGYDLQNQKLDGVVAHFVAHNKVSCAYYILIWPIFQKLAFSDFRKSLISLNFQFVIHFFKSHFDK